MGRSKGTTTGKPSALLDTRVIRGMGASPMICRDSGHSSNAFHKRSGRIIKLLSMQEILDESFVQKM